jgi:hypothetical protein
LHLLSSFLINLLSSVKKLKAILNIIMVVIQWHKFEFNSHS